MVEEKSSVENGAANGDMPPQEVSQKSPLTDGSPAQIEVAKSENESTKVEIGNEEEEEFRGLTKDQLMKYSKDPFWVRLRYFLLFLFWAGWVAMLVIAILIIVQAPQCEPPPTMQWLQQSPIVGLAAGSVVPSDIVAFMSSLSISSLYLPALISEYDYFKLNVITNPSNVAEFVRNTCLNVTSNNMACVTDYVPNPVKNNHPWVVNDSYDGLMTDKYYLNYTDARLPDELEKVFSYWSSDYNVTGFIVPQMEVDSEPAVVNVTDSVNVGLKAQDIVVSTSLVLLEVDLDLPGAFKEFIESMYSDWHYYSYNPIGDANTPNTQPRLNCVTLTLMLLPGTPLMQVTDTTQLEATLGEMIRSCVDLRDKDAIKFGETQFANTTQNVVAFTRTMKGTPGYAVAVNLGEGDVNATETINFSALSYVPDSGTVVYSISGKPDSGAKISMKDLDLKVHDGIVVQFVAEY